MDKAGTGARLPTRVGEVGEGGGGGEEEEADQGGEWWQVGGGGDLTHPSHPFRADFKPQS